MALVLYWPVFWVLLGLQVLFLLWLARRLRLRWKPAWVLRTAIVGLVLVGIFSPQGEFVRSEIPLRQVMVLDLSDSVSPAARTQIKEQAQGWKAAGDNHMLVVYGNKAHTVLQAGAPWPDVDGRASNLAAALNLAAGLLGEAPGKVLLASDGLVEPASVEAAVAHLAHLGHRLDVIPLQTRDSAEDGYVGPLWAPSNLWDTPFDILLPIYPPLGREQVDLQLKVNGQAIEAQPEQLEGNYFKIRVPSQDRRIITLEVTASFEPGSPGDDPFPQNNSAFATLQVFAAPKVLFITSTPLIHKAASYIRVLNQNGIQVDVLSPEEFPTDLVALEKYRVIFLHNFLADRLEQEQMLSLQVFVSRLAGGLVFLGGRNSYTLGGYKNTLLEPVLPVKLEPPPRSERPPFVFLLVLDRSSSMESAKGAAIPPIVLAREAAMRSIETLKPEDYLGVLTFSSKFKWDISIRQLGDGLALRQALDAVSRVRAFGGTKMYAAMEEALAGMENITESTPPVRYMLMLSDGRSSDGSSEKFEALAQSAQEKGITISTIALGEEADLEVMAEIARAGKGRYYSVFLAGELPRIMVLESQAANSDNIQSGRTSLKLGEADHPILSGMSTRQLPTLISYNALSSKADEGAEDVLVSASFEDPILSVWQYGLGRVVAWMGDIGEEWTEDWLSNMDRGVFWSQVVRYALVNPALGPAQVNVQVGDTHLVIDAAIQDALGDPVNLTQVTFSYADLDEEVHTFVVPQVGPGVYQLEIVRPPEGAYRAVLAYQSGEGQQVEVPAPFAVNSPPEWQPPDPTVGNANLIAWAEMAGGRVVADAILSVEDISPEQADMETNTWWWRVLLALILLWPLEIALRRRWLPWV